MAFWEIRNLGFGERSARRAAGARVEQARYEQLRMMDRVAREISDAHTQVQSARQQIAVAEDAIVTAQDSYERNINRIRQGQGLPIEALQSIDALDRGAEIVTSFHLNCVGCVEPAKYGLVRCAS